MYDCAHFRFMRNLNNEAKLQKKEDFQRLEEQHFLKRAFVKIQIPEIRANIFLSSFTPSDAPILIW